MALALYIQCGLAPALAGHSGVAAPPFRPMGAGFICKTDDMAAKVRALRVQLATRSLGSSRVLFCRCAAQVEEDPLRPAAL